MTTRDEQFARLHELYGDEPYGQETRDRVDAFVASVICHVSKGDFELYLGKARLLANAIARGRAQS